MPRCSPGQSRSKSAARKSGAISRNQRRAPSWWQPHMGGSDIFISGDGAVRGQGAFKPWSRMASTVGDRNIGHRSWRRGATRGMLWYGNSCHLHVLQLVTTVHAFVPVIYYSGGPRQYKGLKKECTECLCIFPLSSSCSTASLIVHVIA